MSDIHKIRVIGDATYPQRAQVFIDDKEIHGVTNYKLEHEASGLASITIWAYGDTEFEEYGTVDMVTSDVDVAVGGLKDAVKRGSIDIKRMGEILADILQYMPRE